MLFFFGESELGDDEKGAGVLKGKAETILRATLL